MMLYNHNAHEAVLQVQLLAHRDDHGGLLAAAVLPDEPAEAVDELRLEHHVVHEEQPGLKDARHNSSILESLRVSKEYRRRR